MGKQFYLSNKKALFDAKQCEFWHFWF